MLSVWSQLSQPGHTFSIWDVLLLFLTLVIGWAGKTYGEPFIRWLGAIAYQTFQATRKLSRAQSAVSPDSKGLWLADKIPVERPQGYDSYFSQGNRDRIPIIVVANLKGGVGKTTTAANLAAHYAIAKSESVLLLDFDYQGSLSRMALSNDNYNSELQDQIGGRVCRASTLLDVGTADWLVGAALPVQDIERARVIPSFYSLATAENRIMIEWLLGLRTQDVRYRLASILHDKRIAEKFKRIIIDAPPRLTTACVEALCAATHVVIPTVLDDLSAETVATFADQLRVHQSLWPNLNLLGILGTMTTRATIDSKGQFIDTALNATELSALQKANDAYKLAFANAPAHWSNAGALPLNAFTPDKAELARAAGSKIAYAQDGRNQAQKEAIELIRASFDRLGDEIDKRIGWSTMPPPVFQP